MQTRPQINALTATRAVAALLVFIHHAGSDIFPFSYFPYIFHVGNIAVGYFFVLSGFVLYISYGKRDVPYTEYLKRRVARILPIYLFALLLSLGVAVAFQSYNLFSLRSLSEVLLSALCVQSFVPSYPVVLNFPAWSISVEMFFYFLFPWLLLLLKKHLKVFVLLTIVLYALSQYFNMKSLSDGYKFGDNVFDIITFSPQIHLSQFLIGMTGGYIFLRIRPTFPRYTLLPVLVLALIILLIAIKPPAVSFQVGLIAPLFMVLILLIAINNPRLLNLRPFVFLGEISYGIYILQHPVYTTLDMLNKKFVQMPNALLFYCSLVVLLATASATWYFIELPFRKKWQGASA